VPTLTGRVLFVVIVLSHVRRRIVAFQHHGVSTAEWTANKSSTHSGTTPRPDGCIAIATAPIARHSGVAWRAWPSPKSQRPRVRGRIRTPNA
jgi:hypothetical protein